MNPIAARSAGPIRKLPSRVLRRLGFEAALLPRILLRRDTGPWPKIVFATAAVIAVSLGDITAGIAAIAAGLLGGRLLAPAFPRPWQVAPGWIEAVQFRLRILQADLSNFYMLQHQGEDGFLITAKNSGSHWLKFMLNVALSEQFGVPPPAFSTGPQADHLVGRGGRRRHPRGLPYIATSHTIPSGLFPVLYGFRMLRRVPIVILVRDIGDAMRSNFFKWDYPGTLTDYIRGDPTGRRHVADIWWYMHFFNRWGDIGRAQPGLVLMVRYEDLKREPEILLPRIAKHFGIELRESALRSALRYVDREAMRRHQDDAYGEIVIPNDAARDQTVFREQDNRIFEATLARHLRRNEGALA